VDGYRCGCNASYWGDIVGYVNLGFKKGIKFIEVQFELSDSTVRKIYEQLTSTTDASRQPKPVNNTEKKRIILSVIKPGERLDMSEIVRRLKNKGYNWNGHHLGMFIRQNLKNESLTIERTSQGNIYSRRD